VKSLPLEVVKSKRGFLRQFARVRTGTSKAFLSLLNKSVVRISSCTRLSGERLANRTKWSRSLN